MKKLVFIVFAVLIANFTIASNPPENVKWRVKLAKGAKWTKLNSVGIFTISDGESLIGIGEDGKIKWTVKDLGSVDSENYKELRGTPLIYIDDLPTVKKGFVKEKRSVIIDGWDGQVLFDSDQNDLDKVTSSRLLLSDKKVWLEGVKGDERVIALANIGSGKIKWTVPKPQQFKKITLKDNSDTGPVPTSDGNILYHYFDKLYCLDGATGSVVWEKEHKEIKRLFTVPNSPYFYMEYSESFWADLFGAFDPSNGEMVFPIVTDDEVGPVNLLFENKEYQKALKEKDKDKAQAMWNEAAAKLDEETMNGRSVGILRKVYPSSSNPNEFMIEYSRGFNYIHYLTGEKRWKKTPTFTGTIRDIYENEDGYLIKLVEDEKWKVAFLDKEGKPVLEETFLGKGSSLFLLKYDEGRIVYLTGKTAAAIDITTGKNVFAPFKHKYDDKKPTLVKYDTAEKKLILFYKKDVIAISESGVETLYEKVKFKGGKEDNYPTRLQVLKDGYLLTSDQNMLMVKKEGGLAYQKYYRAPGLPAFVRNLGAAALGVAVNLGARYLMSQAADELYKAGQITATDAFILQMDAISLSNSLEGEGSIVSALATTAGIGASSSAYKAMANRSFYNREGQDYKLVLTKLDSGDIGYLKVDKATGTPINEIALNDKDPDIRIDDYTNSLYYLPNNREIVLYAL